MTSTALSSRTRVLLRLGTIALGLLALSPAMARKDDRQKPMNVEHADSFDGKYAPNSVTTLHGHVVISQGTMKITGDLAKVYFDADQNVSRIEITGRPAHIEQLDDNGNLMTGDAGKLDYDNDQGIAVLSDHASIKQKGRGAAYGDKLTYDTRTSQMSGESAGDGMVHMTFLPKHAAAAQPAPTAPAPAQSGPAPAPDHH
ncbi:MAG: lipopolysaccharide transport periplasmic protein LptA [Pseudomonadota bacterium]|nr:lipopolysaccharide transport periplasmic protein LptA [Pseudomonadota bacterium]